MRFKSLEIDCTHFSWPMKFASPRFFIFFWNYESLLYISATFDWIEKRLQRMYFPVFIAKFLRTPILKNICKWLCLDILLLCAHGVTFALSRSVLLLPFISEYPESKGKGHVKTFIKYFKVPIGSVKVCFCVYLIRKMVVRSRSRKSWSTWLLG